MIIVAPEMLGNNKIVSCALMCGRYKLGSCFAWCTVYCNLTSRSSNPLSACQAATNEQMAHNASLQAVGDFLQFCMYVA